MASEQVQGSAPFAGPALSSSQQAQGTNAATPEQMLSLDHAQLLAQITGQLMDSTRVQKEAACQEVRQACEMEHSRKRKRLQDAAFQEKQQLIHEHETAIAEIARSTARRDQDKQQFLFTVRGQMTPELSGSVPRCIFEAEPDSVLNKTYNGEWAYAANKQGRACINSDPAHWPLILNWLSFGSVPSQPSAGFIAECKYWQLDNLLAKVEEQRTAANELAQAINTNKHMIILSDIKEDGRTGFLTKIKIHNFLQRFTINKQVDTCFDAFGRLWNFRIADNGAFLYNFSSSTVKRAILHLSLGKAGEEWGFIQPEEHDFEPRDGGFGFRWEEPSHSVERLYGTVDLQGRLHVTIKLLFQQPK